MNDPVLSIVVPVFNVEKYLPECVDSLLAQTLTDFELILIDDGSCDNSPAICDEYASRDPRVRVLHQTNRGPQAAVISGVHLARGAYLGFVDGDDWVCPDMFELLLRQTLGTDAEIVQCGYRMVSSGVAGRSVAAAPELCEYDGVFVREVLVPQLMTFFQVDDSLMAPVRWNKLFSRDLVARNVHYCDTRVRIGEDLNMTLPALLDARRIVCLSECLYNYRANEQSATRRPMVGLWSQVRILHDALTRVCADKAPEVMAHADAYYDYMTLLAIVNTTSVTPGLAASASQIRSILRQNPMRGEQRLLNVRQLSLSLRIVHRLAELKLVPLVPLFLTARDVVGGLRRFSHGSRRGLGTDA